MGMVMGMVMNKRNVGQVAQAAAAGLRLLRPQHRRCYYCAQTQMSSAISTSLARGGTRHGGSVDTRLAARRASRGVAGRLVGLWRGLLRLTGCQDLTTTTTTTAANNSDDNSNNYNNNYKTKQLLLLLPPLPLSCPVRREPAPSVRALPSPSAAGSNMAAPPAVGPSPPASASASPHAAPPSVPATPATPTAPPAPATASAASNAAAPPPPSAPDVALTFDEAAVRALCASDVAQPLMSDWITQSCGSVHHLSTFLRKRAAIEEEYARSMAKLVRSASESYSDARTPASNSSVPQALTGSHGHGPVRAGSYVQAWQGILSAHTAIVEGRQRFAHLLVSVADEAASLAREADRQKRSTRDAGGRTERALLDAEASRDKARQRFDQSAEELERILLMKSGENRNSDLAVMANQNAAAAEEARATSPESPSAAPSRDANAGKRPGKRLNRAVGAVGKAFNKPRGAAQLQRAEDDVRLRTSQASDLFRRETMAADQMRNEYFAGQYPRLVRQLKDTADEIDAGGAYHMARYALLYENAILADARAIAPLAPLGTNNGAPGSDAPVSRGLRDLLAQIDNRADFTTFMQNWQVAHGSTYRGPRRGHPPTPSRETLSSSASGSVGTSGIHATNASATLAGAGGDYSLASIPSRATGQSSATAGPWTEGGAAPDGAFGLPPALPGSRRVFGVDLTEQLERDGVAVPPVLALCAEAVEAVALDTRGIYRVSGIASRVQRLKRRFDDDWTRVNLFEPVPPDPNDPDAPGVGEPEDINNVSSCLKLWLRELPEPLLTFGLYEEFVEGSKIGDDWQRQIRLHGLINELPDANYATLKALMQHLSNIRAHESTNQMGLQNLGIVFGPTLLSTPIPRNMPPAQAERERDQINFRDMSAQCRVIETILDKYEVRPTCSCPSSCPCTSTYTGA